MPWADRPCQPADIAKRGVEASEFGDSDGIFHPYPPRLGRPIFSMLKIAILNVEGKRFRMGEKNFFPHRPETSSDECQHADIAESCLDEGWENGKGRCGRASVLSSTRGLANG